jgi:hypothetical protein
LSLNSLLLFLCGAVWGFALGMTVAAAMRLREAKESLRGN